MKFLGQQSLMEKVLQAVKALSRMTYSNETSHNIANISRRLIVIQRQPLLNGIERELPLKAVHEETKDHITNEDEHLSANE